MASISATAPFSGTYTVVLGDGNSEPSASGDYDPKKIVGRKMIEPAEKPQFVEFIGNIEDFPLGKNSSFLKVQNDFRTKWFYL